MPPVPSQYRRTSLPIRTWVDHRERWKDCHQCACAANRCTVVLGRGVVPCQLLLIGEAPGDSEDAVGKPFVGPAGKLLDRIVRTAVPSTVSVAWTNLLACTPGRDEQGRQQEPSHEQVTACSNRLIEMVRIANPALICAVGSLARDYLDSKWNKHVRIHGLCSVCGLPQHLIEDTTISGAVPISVVRQHLRGRPVMTVTCDNGHYKAPTIEIPQVAIVHPAAILRMPEARKGLEIQRAVVILASAVEQVILKTGNPVA